MLKDTFIKRIGFNVLTISGGVVVIFLTLAAVFAPLICPYNPEAIDRYHILSSPDMSHLLGTDDLGRDVLSRMIYGARISLSVGFVSVGLATLTGIAAGAAAGFYGSFVDRIIMRFVDIMLAIPTFFLILAVIAFLDSTIWNIMAVIGLTSWMGVARLVRAEFLSLKSREFVLSAKSIGASDIRLIIKHMLPNALAPVIVSAVLGIAGAILVESALSFLGIGVQPPTPSWGNILSAGKDNLEIAWWLSVFPGMAILITVLGYNLLGEGLRDVLDPRLWDGQR
ncbi:ABC transporter permease [Candidatus Magnetomonas plexicatena]|uniref:ABC transporter permease n=1 Tax=Candidatus Magnetomonas plexicatena TaxID=2552947 RepID=UPI004033052F